MTKELLPHQKLLAISHVPISNAYEPFYQKRISFIRIGDKFVPFKKNAILQWPEEDETEAGNQPGADDE